MGKVYVWKRKELYRMPYESNSRFYGMIKCARWGERGYYLGRYPKSFAQLEAMTTDVDVTIEDVPHEDCPFQAQKNRPFRIGFKPWQTLPNTMKHKDS